MLQINTVAPLRMAERFIGTLEKGERKTIVNISSRMGSIASNDSGGSYIYRSSKAALNMVTKGLSVDLGPKGFTVVSFHPGWVQTDMGGESADIPADTSIAGMRKVIVRAFDSGQWQVLQLRRRRDPLVGRSADAMRETAMQDFHLAQINVGRIVAPIDGPKLAEFVSRLDAINALADRDPGFVWRLQSDSGNATDIQVSADPHFIVNMSLWRDLESLFTYVYKTDHTKVMAQRRKWFEKPRGAFMALWWLPAGEIPPLKTVWSALR